MDFNMIRVTYNYFKNIYMLYMYKLIREVQKTKGKYCNKINKKIKTTSGTPKTPLCSYGDKPSAYVHDIFAVKKRRQTHMTVHSAG